MLTRSTTSTVTFRNAFTFGDSQQDFPAGTYDIVSEEELLQSLSFRAYRHSATFLMVRGCGGKAGQTMMIKSTKEDLARAIARDEALCGTTHNSDAALSPQEDMT